MHGERERITRQTGRQPADFVYINCLTNNLSVVDVAEYSHVIMGGSGLVNISAGKHDWFGDAERIILDCGRLGVPFFGICFGMQFLAHAFGGKLLQDKANKEVGGVRVRTLATAGTFFEFLPREFDANAVHSDFVVEVPPDFQVLGSSKKCPVHILAHRSKPLFGVQFHPEHSGASIAAGLRRYGEKYCTETELRDILASTVENGPEVESILRRFLELS